MIDGSLNSRNEPEIEIALRGPNGLITATAIIDTGFSDYLTLDSRVLDDLGVVWVDRTLIKLADGSVILTDLYELDIFWNQNWKRILVQSAETTPLLGVSMLAGTSLLIEFTTEGIVRIDSLDDL